MINGLDKLITKFDREIIEGLTESEHCQIFNALINLKEYQETGSIHEFKKNKERIRILIGYIINEIHSCPFDDKSGIDFEKECVGFGDAGCCKCVIRHLDKLNCQAACQRVGEKEE